MNKFTIFLWGSVLITATFLSGCSNNEMEPTESDENLLTRAYLKGTVNGDSIIIEQKKWTDYSISPTTMTRTYKNGDHDRMDSLCYYQWRTFFTLRKNERKYALSISLTDIHERNYIIVPNQDKEGTRVNLVDITNKDNQSVYELKPGTTFKVRLNHFDMTSTQYRNFPLLEGSFEGTLYNTKEPDDSITFQNMQFMIGYTDESMFSKKYY